MSNVRSGKPLSNYASVEIAIICVLTYVMQNLYPNITDTLSLSGSYVLQKPWTLVTYMFLHGSVEHIFYNMFALLMFGCILESIIGTKKFLIVYFSSGIISGLAGILFYHSIIGASGAIFGIIGCLTVIKPNMAVFAFGMPMPLALASFLWVFLDLVGIVFPDQIAHAGHIGGFAFGAFLGFLMRKKYNGNEENKTFFMDEKKMEDWEDDWMYYKAPSR